MKKTAVTLLLVCFVVCLLSGCGPREKMPFNGDIRFHDIMAVIPDSYIRDSTESNDDLWVFEKNRYKSMIIMQRTDVKADADIELDNYVQVMLERGADSSRGDFLLTDAVLSIYYLDDVFCQEILFVYNNSFYAFALRGGTEAEFQELLNDLNTLDTLDIYD